MFGISGKIMLVMGAVMVAGAAAFWFYFQHSQEQLRLAAAEVATLEVAKAHQDAVIGTMQAQIQVQNENFQILTTAIAESDMSNAELERLFSRHDLGNLAANRPGLIENRVNSATENVFNSFEHVTDPGSYNE